MKIVNIDSVTTNPGDQSWDWLAEFGEYTIYDRTNPDQIVERAKDADILIINKSVITSEIIDKLPNLKLIALQSTGYNVVDCEYARKKNILVANIPSYSTNAVAQMVFAFILEFASRVGMHNEAVHNNEWCECPDFCFWKAPLTEIEGKTIGIIGYGSIGKRVAKLAKAYDMNVLVFTPHPRDDENVKFVDLDYLLKNSDYITCHCPLTNETNKLINSENIAKMKETAIVINTSRGPVIDDNALAEALNNGKIAGAGLDVLTVEPPTSDNPLLTAKNCLITPHIAWASYETRKRLFSILKSNIEQFINGTPQNIVN